MRGSEQMAKEIRKVAIELTDAIMTDATNPIEHLIVLESRVSNLYLLNSNSLHLQSRIEDATYWAIRRLSASQEQGDSYQKGYLQAVKDIQEGTKFRKL